MNALKFAQQLGLAVLAADPSPTQDGALYYSSATNKLRARVNGAWVDITTGSVALTGQTLNDGEIIVGNASNLSAAIDTDGVGDITADHVNGLTIKSDVIVNADINSAAAIAYSKLAALTASRALQSDGSGFVSASAVTNTELGYVSGVTSAIQTQLNNISSQVDGLSWKKYVVAASTANVTLATTAENGDVIDGVTLATGDRILLKDQTAPAENGIYIVAASGAPSRASDANSWNELVSAAVMVSEGTVNADKKFVCTSDEGGTLDTTALVFINFAAGIAYTADGQGIELSGQQFQLELDGSTLSKSASGVKVADLGIANAQISASAAIAVSKLAALTASRAVVSDGSGFLSASSTTSAEVGHLSGVTSSIQTQLNGKASLALDNLAAVAINTSLISDANNTDDLGSDANEWKDIFAHSLKHGDATNPDLNIQTTSNNGDINLAAHGTGNLDIDVNKVRRSKDLSNFIEEEYIDSYTLLASQTNTVIADLTVAHASYEGIEMVYKIKEATTNRVRIGIFRVVTNGTDIVYSDQFTESADATVSFSAAINGANIEISYTTGSNNKVARLDVKRFRS